MQILVVLVALLLLTLFDLIPFGKALYKWKKSFDNAEKIPCQRISGNGSRASLSLKTKTHLRVFNVTGGDRQEAKTSLLPQF
jgi:hypothetical protein